jgi:hypothetical protein
LDVTDKGGKVPNLLSGYTETNSIRNRTTVSFILENADEKRSIKKLSEIYMIRSQLREKYDRIN